jgi:hypothetical protein
MEIDLICPKLVHINDENKHPFILKYPTVIKPNMYDVIESMF